MGRNTDPDITAFVYLSPSSPIMSIPNWLMRDKRFLSHRASVVALIWGFAHGMRHCHVSFGAVRDSDGKRSRLPRATRYLPYAA